MFAHPCEYIYNEHGFYRKEENKVEKCAKIIGAKIKDIRRSKNETQKQLSIAVGVVQQSVAAWESGRCLPNIPSLIRIAEHYAVSSDLILGLTNEDKLP